MRYVGTIRAGVSLKTATFTPKDTDKSGKPKSIIVELDAPDHLEHTRYGQDRNFRRGEQRF